MFERKFIKSSDPILTATNLVAALRNPIFPLDIEKIALSVGIQGIQELPNDKFEGLLVSLPGKTAGFISISKNIRETTRKRFTIAHELGHFLITTHKGQYLCNSYDLSDYLSTSNPHEKEANRFAAELLMPKQYFSVEIGNKIPSYSLFQSLTLKFESSLQSTLIRYKELTDESIAIVLSENSFIKWVLPSEEFNYYIGSKEELSPETVAFEYFKGNHLPMEFEEVEKDAWFDASEIRHKIIVSELSFPLPYYNQVLSVIWINEDEDDIEDYEDEFDGYLKLKTE